MDFDAMLDYVKKKLEDGNAIKPKNIHHQFRNRYKHTVRVYKWCMRLIDDRPNCNSDILYTSAIFHDVGYALGKDNHAITSAFIFNEYAKENNLDKKFTEIVTDIILNHSDKNQLKNPDISDELCLLLEADLLDEEGAMGLVWDLMAEGNKNPDDYDDGLKCVWVHSAHILSQDFMVTPIAKKVWSEKKEFVRKFIQQLEYDLFV